MRELAQLGCQVPHGVSPWTGPCPARSQPGRGLCPWEVADLLSTFLAIGARSSFFLWDMLAVSAQLCSFWRPQETVHFLAFSNSRKLPTVLGLWLLASSIRTLTSASVTCSLSASHMDPCDDTGPAWIIQDPLPSPQLCKVPFAMGDRFLPAQLVRVSPRKRCHCRVLGPSLFLPLAFQPTRVRPGRHGTCWHEVLVAGA